MSREWEPGDVARTREGVTVFLVRAGRIGDGEHWTTGSLGKWTGDIDTLRPLVVIDLEDREAVGRFANLIENCGDENHCTQYPCGSLSCWTDRIADALREFANPKPPRCAASLDVQYSDGKGHPQHCILSDGHEGPHSGDDFMWTAVQP